VRAHEAGSVAGVLTAGSPASQSPRASPSAMLPARVEAVGRGRLVTGRLLGVELLDLRSTAAGFDCFVSRAHVTAGDASDLVVVVELVRTGEATVSALGARCSPSQIR